MDSKPCLGLLLCLAPAVLFGGCSDADRPQADVVPIHLEDLLATAQVVGAEVNPDLAKPMRWSFDAGNAGWRALPNLVPGGTPAEVEPAGAGLRVRLTATTLAPEDPREVLHGGVYVDVEKFDLEAWTQVLVEARATGPVRWIGIGYNVRDEPSETPDEQWGTWFYGAGTDVTPDGEVHVYRTALLGQGGPVTDAVRQIVIEAGADGPAEVEILSVALVPVGATYADAGVGIRSVSSSAHQDFGPQRRTLYTHVPSRISYQLQVPSAGRLDLALGSFGSDTRMTVRVDQGDSTETVLEESVGPGEAWRQRSIDLSKWSGRNVSLSLATEAATESRPGIAFWASPTVSSRAPTTAVATARPNVIFYVIDGASAGYMSVYGYQRPTTPNLERIAEEGLVFENAHSNATWTMPSTASFMTSLYHSVLGGLRDDANPVPANVKTMAEHFHEAGFHTGVFTFNPNAGSLSGLDRGVDVFRDFGKRGDPLNPIEAISSKILHEQFWQWREAYPGPYWAHFQTTDVHPPHHPQDPFRGRIVPAEESEALVQQMAGLRFPFNHTSASVHEHWQEQLKQHAIDPHEFYGTMQGAHDEAMMHQDHRLGELVDRLKASGEWEHTLLIIASDHGHPAASYPRFGRGQLDPQPPAWEGALLGEFESHIPMIFVWPGHIEGGRRIDAAVSMIDMLPTVLDLAGLPQPEIAQGQSLAPLLLGQAGWEPRPVVFDEFRVAESGELVGNLELLDGRWGESLEIRTADQDASPSLGRHPTPAGGRWKALEFPSVSRFLLYDLESDPRAIRNVTAEHPEVAAEAQRRIWRIWKEHQTLAETFGAGDEAQMSPEQLESLRALGYIE